MRQWVLCGVAVVGLAGCAVPFASSEDRVSVEQVPVTVAVEAETESVAEPVAEPVAEDVAEAEDTGPQITEGNEIALAVALQTPPKEPSVLGRLFGRKATPVQADLVVGDAPENTPVAAAVETPDATEEVVAVAVAEAVPAPEDVPVVNAAAAAPRKGLLGIFRRGSAPADAPVPEDLEEGVEGVAVAPDAIAPPAPEVTPAESTVAVAVPVEETERPRRGLFGPRRANAPVSAEVSPAATEGPAAFGAFRSACGLSSRALGKQVDQAAGFKLYDSDPNALTPRAFYVTGFSDRCAREFVGSVALFGTIQLYELVHFGGGAPSPEAGSTGAAYRKIRQRSCGAARKGVCSASGTKALEKDTAWLNVYGQKGRSTYHEVLLSRGAVVADTVK
jgi:hypothetical protein